jgi:hypothetical protein
MQLCYFVSHKRVMMRHHHDTLMRDPSAPRCITETR